MSKLVLASASPQRKALLESVGIYPDIIKPADIDETPKRNELPSSYTKRVAKEKALVVKPSHGDSYILAADTIGAVGRRILLKASNKQEAREMLLLMSGRRHRVYSGVCIIDPDGKMSVKTVLTRVEFKKLGKEELDHYLDSGAWEGKSGAYGIQTQGGGFVKALYGSYSNVIGLPLVETKNMLKGLGFKTK